ncbi:reverse transcriptase [Caerostris extrusa]|uniref:Reverse transcriptase n=1 Tax=Caerostris extrusa TaxID=172846 RepID=A0AAV4RMF1_CAEEX|nr:reverse transcriptase [Caerostris extrusa]
MPPPKNGILSIVERWNRNFKKFGNKSKQKYEKNWDLLLPNLLFAYRETPHSITRLPSFQLVYGRLPSDPSSLLKDIWTSERSIPTTTTRFIENHLQNITGTLRKAYEIVFETAVKSQEQLYFQIYSSFKREIFCRGREILILLPSSSHKILNIWK